MCYNTQSDDIMKYIANIKNKENRALKKKIKIIVSLSLAVLFIASAGVLGVLGATNRLTGLVFNIRYPLKAQIHYNSNSLGVSGDSTLYIDWINLFTHDYDDFDGDLARLSYFLCMDAHDNGLVTTTKISSGETPVSNTSETNNTAFPESLHFFETMEFDVGDGESENSNDTTKMVVSAFMQKYYKTYLLYFNVSFVGTDNSTNTEWLSNFDIGSEQSYYTGSSTDWATKENHKGFDVAANRAIEILQKYFATFGASGIAGNVVVGINGYSRGAAIANIVASKFYSSDYDLGDNAACFAYTFATPATTTAENSEEYNYIHNVINNDDIITSIPTSAMGFHRYGQDIVFDLDDESMSEAKEIYNTITGKTFSSPNLTNLLASMNDLCASRDDYYYINTESTGLTRTKTYSSESTAISQREEIVATFESLCPTDTYKYVEVTDVVQDGSKYSFTYTIAPSFIGQIFPAIRSTLSNGSVYSLMPVLQIFWYGNYQNFMSSLVSAVSSNSSAFADMHYPAAYFAYLETMGTEVNF